MGEDLKAEGVSREQMRVRSQGGSVGAVSRPVGQRECGEEDKVRAMPGTGPRKGF